MVGAYGLGFESAQIFQFLMGKGGEDSFPTFSKWSGSTKNMYISALRTNKKNPYL